jgi:nucleoside-diphosphate-sugar epimerase
MKKNILITGITSSFLSKLSDKIDKSKYNIIGITRTPQNSIETVEYEIGNITDGVFINKIVQKNIDIIIHGAAITHSYDEKKYFDINFTSTKLLVDKIKIINPQIYFVFISSRTASPDSGGYGLSKLKAEEYIKNNLENWLIIRPAEIFGTDKNEGIEKLITDVKTKKIILTPVNIKYKLYPIHIDDALNIMYDAIFTENIKKQILSVNGNDGYTYFELVNVLEKKFKKKVFIIPIPKIIMFALKHLIKLFNIRTSIVPDQIDRLYSKKETQFIKYNFTKVEEYLKL